MMMFSILVPGVGMLKTNHRSGLRIANSVFLVSPMAAAAQSSTAVLKDIPRRTT